MTDRPILFSGPMVRAILAGKKTVTRRVVKPQPPPWANEIGVSAFTPPGMLSARGSHPEHGPSEAFVKQRWDPGDCLWVRESFWQVRSYPMMLPSGEVESGNNWGSLVHYSADGPPANIPNRHYPNGLRGNGISAPDPYADWARRPSIHMARKQSRITLEVTTVRVERLQAIAEEDAKAEGTPPMLGFPDPVDPQYRDAFRQLWDSINGKRAGCAWKDDPWVWCVEFRRIEQP